MVYLELRNWGKYFDTATFGNKQTESSSNIIILTLDSAECALNINVVNASR